MRTLLGSRRSIILLCVLGAVFVIYLMVVSSSDTLEDVMRDAIAAYPGKCELHPQTGQPLPVSARALCRKLVSERTLGAPRWGIDLFSGIASATDIPLTNFAIILRNGVVFWVIFIASMLLLLGVFGFFIWLIWVLSFYGREPISNERFPWGKATRVLVGSTFVVVVTAVLWQFFVFSPSHPHRFGSLTWLERSFSPSHFADLYFDTYLHVVYYNAYVIGQFVLLNIVIASYRTGSRMLDPAARPLGLLGQLVVTGLYLYAVTNIASAYASGLIGAPGDQQALVAWVGEGGRSTILTYGIYAAYVDFSVMHACLPLFFWFYRDALGEGFLATFVPTRVGSGSRPARSTFFAGLRVRWHRIRAGKAEGLAEIDGARADAMDMKAAAEEAKRHSDFLAAKARAAKDEQKRLEKGARTGWFGRWRG